VKTHSTPLDHCILEHLQGTALFYPCCGDDLLLPITTFSPFVSDFWFVDLAYFSQYLLDKQQPVLSEKDGYTFLDKQVRLPAISEEDCRAHEKVHEQPPYILTERYCHLGSERRICVHRHLRRGPSALRKEIDRLGVFFYRGDSEEGSGTLWLTVREWHKAKKRKRRWLIHEVLDKLIDGGLIATDGSMCKGEHNPYREFRRFHGNQEVSDTEAVKLMSPFEDDTGRFFRCIGCLGKHYNGPTMVRPVTKCPKQSED
jgi:hypothetical protein